LNSPIEGRRAKNPSLYAPVALNQSNPSSFLSLLPSTLRTYPIPPWRAQNGLVAAHVVLVDSIPSLLVLGGKALLKALIKVSRIVTLFQLRRRPLRPISPFGLAHLPLVLLLHLLPPGSLRLLRFGLSLSTSALWILRKFGGSSPILLGIVTGVLKLLDLVRPRALEGARGRGMRRLPNSLGMMAMRGKRSRMKG